MLRKLTFLNLKSISFNPLNVLKTNFFNKNFCSGLKTIDLIKILRAETNSPLNHIKKALEESNNNLDEAKLWLKKKGFKEAENRMSRTANTKLYGMKVKDNKIAVSSLSCETDFVSGTDIFKNYLNILIDTLAEDQNINKITDEDLDKIIINKDEPNSIFNNMTLLDALKNLISKTQENCKIGVCERFDFSDKNRFVVGSYIHSSPENNPQLGQKASYVVLEIEGGNEKTDFNSLKDLAERLAMQVVACNPKYLNKSDVPKEAIERESKIIRDFVIAEGKVTNSDQIDKVVINKVNSWLEEIVLNEQNYVIVDYDSTEGKTKVGSLVTKKAKQFGCEDLKIKEFKLYI